MIHDEVKVMFWNDAEVKVKNNRCSYIKAKFGKQADMSSCEPNQVSMQYCEPDKRTKIGVSSTESIYSVILLNERGDSYEHNVIWIKNRLTYWKRNPAMGLKKNY